MLFADLTPVIGTLETVLLPRRHETLGTASLKDVWPCGLLRYVLSDKMLYPIIVLLSKRKSLTEIQNYNE